ncbi:uncharacterized protein LOC110821722 [Carica papaya]|uniref:uncharacterized protein LOC110821722 n=1 Tax=Carica papaya TaxID=3649 RepID=UPI000B8CDA01|nr:uncharacterized protein LOC110821722 [Carica papaya]XP_021907337.1 uncharacterized protein LOC110821722 [Carica papaya]XP_021907338.1 uncharacterized protein LOC110821722 [Carica papaya]XP_021907339.1 uncharacterized protein LOC110821722 [Carica papaya]
MASEAPGLSGQHMQQDSTSTYSKTGRNSNNNVSVQTGEEFSMEFLQDRVAARGIHVAPESCQNRPAHNYNQNHHMGYEDLARILGLKRMNSDCPSDISDFASAKGSIKENEMGAYASKLNAYHNEDGDAGLVSRKAFGELNCDRGAGWEPASPLISASEYAHPNHCNEIGVLDGLQCAKMKFLCSFGGKILPRPGDGKLRYVAGETRIISIRKNISWEELVKKTSGICKQPHSIKYQLPGEELDALISVSSDEDLQNMIEEYHGLENVGGSQRLRLFLVPSSDSENISSFEAITMQQTNPDYQYVVAVNGIVDSSPRENSGFLHLASEASQLLTNFDCNPSPHKSSPTHAVPLETKVGFNAHPTQFNGFQHMTSSSTQSPPVSPITCQHRDSTGLHKQVHGNNSSAESSRSFTTAQLPSGNCSIDTTGYKQLPQGIITLMNNEHLNKKVEPSEQGQAHGSGFFDYDFGNAFRTTSTVDHSHNSFDGFSCKRLMHNDGALQSGKPFSCPEDPMDLLSGSTNLIDCHHGIPYSYSDSKLEQQGRQSAYCSQGASPSSPSNLVKTQVHPLIVSSALQGKPIHLHDNINLVNPGCQKNMQDIESTTSERRQPSLYDSQYSGLSCKNEPFHKDTHDINNGYQGAQNHVSKSNLVIPNHCDKNALELDTRNNGDEINLHQGGNVSGRSPDTNVEYKNEMSAVSNQASTPSVDTLRQNIHVLGDKVPVSLLTDFKPFGNVLENFPKFEAAKTATKLPCSLSRAQGSDPSLTWNFEVGGLLSSTKKGSYEKNPLVDFMDGSPSSQVSQGFEKPIASQNDMDLERPAPMRSTDSSLPAVQNYGCPSSDPQKRIFLLEMQNPSKESSIIDNDLIHNPVQMVEALGFAGPADYKKSDAGDAMLGAEKTLHMHANKILLESVASAENLNSFVSEIESSSAVVPRVDMTSSDVNSQSPVARLVDTSSTDFMFPVAPESGNMVPESESEDDNTDDRNKEAPFSDAMIAEMEASIYGLQIIKNADLEELQELGSGTYGTVYHGKWRGTDVAIKRLKKSCFAGRSSEQDRLTKDFWREAQILSNLHHPNVVAFYGVVPDGAGGTLATVTEYMVNGSLRHVLVKDRSLDYRKKLIIAMDAAFGMEYLHSKNIVHFDLKCDNLLVNLRDPQRPICKVGDFGLSRIKRNTLVSGGVRGTLPWMAPELLNGSSSRVSEKVDVFSFGISLWEILTGEEPYEDMHCGAIIGGIVKNTLRPPIPERCDPEWRKLMEQCWSPDPECRPSFTEITNRLRSMSMAVQARGHTIIRQNS